MMTKHAPLDQNQRSMVEAIKSMPYLTITLPDGRQTMVRVSGKQVCHNIGIAIQTYYGELNKQK